MAGTKFFDEYFGNPNNRGYVWHDEAGNLVSLSDEDYAERGMDGVVILTPAPEPVEAKVVEAAPAPVAEESKGGK